MRTFSASCAVPVAGVWMACVATAALVGGVAGLRGCGGTAGPELLGDRSRVTGDGPEVCCCSKFQAGEPVFFPSNRVAWSSWVLGVGCWVLGSEEEKPREPWSTWATPGKYGPSGETSSSSL